MALFNTKANASQIVYGICRYAAVLLSFENIYIMYTTRHKSITIHRLENKNQFNLKKNSDHKAFTTSCIQYTVKASLLFFSLDIIYEDIPISMYKIVQTIGNKNPGGAKAGLFIFV